MYSITTELRINALGKSQTIRLIKLFRLFQVAGLGSFSIFFPLYLVSHDISLMQIGLIMAIPALVGIFSGAIWSSFSDAIGRRKPFLIQATILMALFAFAITLVSSFRWFLVLGLIRALLAPMEEGLITTSLFKVSDHQARATAYSGFAIWGSIGWAGATILAGIAVSLWGIEAAMYFASLLFFIAMLISLQIPEPKEIKKFTKMSEATLTQLHIVANYFVPIRELLNNKKMLIFLMSSLPLLLAINAANRFFPIYLDSIGVSPVFVGLAFTIPAILEIPIFFRVGKLSDKSGSRHPLLIFSACIYALLFLLISLILRPMLLFIIFTLLTPFAWPPLITGSATLVSEIVPVDRWVTGQTLYNIWMWSISGIIGPLIGGFAADMWGFSVMFAIVAALAVISALSFQVVRKGGAT